MEEKAKNTSSVFLPIFLVLFLLFAIAAIGFQIYTSFYYGPKVSEVGKLRMDIDSLSSEDALKINKMMGERKDVLFFHYSDEDMTSSLSITFDNDGKSTVKEKFPDCKTWRVNWNKDYREYCDQKIREIRKDLRQKIPALAKRPM